MAKYKVIPGGVCAAKGFSASGVHAGFRANPNKLDLAIIAVPLPVFTPPTRCMAPPSRLTAPTWWTATHRLFW